VHRVVHGDAHLALGSLQQQQQQQQQLNLKYCLINAAEALLFTSAHGLSSSAVGDQHLLLLLLHALHPKPLLSLPPLAIQ
jgi:hypothetical protein